MFSLVSHYNRSLKKTASIIIIIIYKQYIKYSMIHCRTLLTCHANINIFKETYEEASPKRTGLSDTG